MGVDFMTVLAFLVVGIFAIFCIFPLIGKTMRFLVDQNTESNIYRANLMNGMALLIFLAGLVGLIYCVGLVVGILLTIV